MDPYLQEFLQIHGIECVGKPVIPTFDELNTDIVREALTGEVPESYESELKSVVRPPSLCAGCPHRGFFQAIKKKKNLMINGDIGCYTLGANAPLNALDTAICMGASLSMAHGASRHIRWLVQRQRQLVCWVTPHSSTVVSPASWIPSTTRVTASA